MRLVRLGLCGLLFIAACTSENPHYTGALDLNALGDGAVGEGDLASTKKGDMAGSATCVDGQRSCTATGSLGCAGGVYVEDRICPAGSMCSGGHCPAPTGGGPNVGKDCAPAGHPTESICVAGITSGIATVPSCQPFFTPSSTAPMWICAPRIGVGLPGQACTSGAMCRSGFCGDNGSCYRACITQADCPSTGGPWKCEAVKIIVEGALVQAPSCVL
jgi:hypothetical protein